MRRRMGRSDRGNVGDCTDDGEGLGLVDDQVMAWRALSRRTEQARLGIGLSRQA